MNLNTINPSELLLKIRNKDLSLFLKKFFLTNQFNLMIESGYLPDEAALNIRNNINVLIKDNNISDKSKLYILEGECNTEEFQKLKNPIGLLQQLKWELRNLDPDFSTDVKINPENKKESVKEPKKVVKPSIKNDIDSTLNGKNSAKSIKTKLIINEVITPGDSEKKNELTKDDENAPNTPTSSEFANEVYHMVGESADELMPIYFNEKKKDLKKVVNNGNIDIIMSEVKKEVKEFAKKHESKFSRMFDPFSEREENVKLKSPTKQKTKHEELKEKSIKSDKQEKPEIEKKEVKITAKPAKAKDAKNSNRNIPIYDHNSNSLYLNHLDKEVFCFFCKKSSKDDYFFRKCGEMHGPINYSEKLGKTPTETYFHFYCAFWAPMVTYTYNEELELHEFSKIKETFNLSKKLSCFVCKHKGAGLGCWYNKCKKSFHYLCGKQARCFFDAPNVFCEEHVNLSENKSEYRRKTSTDSFTTVDN